MYDFDSKDIPIMPLRTGSGTYTPPRTISYNPIENALLVCYVRCVINNIKNKKNIINYSLNINKFI